MWLAGIIVTTLLCLSCAESTGNPIHVVVSKFNEFNEEADVLSGLEKLQVHSRELIKLARPIRKLLLAHVKGEDNDDTTEAMAELHKLFDAVDATLVPRRLYDANKEYIFEPLTALTTSDRNTSENTRIFGELKDRLYEIFVEPDFLFDPYLNSMYYTVHNPLTIRARIDTSVVFRCRQPSEAEMGKFAKVQQAIRRLESRTNLTLLDAIGYNYEMKNILGITIHARVEEADKMVEYIDKINDPSLLITTVRNGIAQIYHNNNNYVNQRCELPQTYEVNQAGLLSELSKTRTDLLRLVIAETVIGKTEPSTWTYFFRRLFGYDATEKALSSLGRVGQNLANWARNLKQTA